MMITSAWSAWASKSIAAKVYHSWECTVGEWIVKILLTIPIFQRYYMHCYSNFVDCFQYCYYAHHYAPMTYLVFLYHKSDVQQQECCSKKSGTCVQRVSVYCDCKYNLTNKKEKHSEHVCNNSKKFRTCRCVYCDHESVFSDERKTVNAYAISRAICTRNMYVTRCTSMKWRFEKQMAHQCSVKTKYLTLYTILLYHQQVSNAQSDLKSVCIVLCCCI